MELGWGVLKLFMKVEILNIMNIDGKLYFRSLASIIFLHKIGLTKWLDCGEVFEGITRDSKIFPANSSYFISFIFFYTILSIHQKNEINGFRCLILHTARSKISPPIQY